jgi:hypothetical protein
VGCFLGFGVYKWVYIVLGRFYLVGVLAWDRMALRIISLAALDFQGPRYGYTRDQYDSV